MLYHVLKGKIHRAHVTDHNVDYEGSVTLDAHLMAAAGIVPYEKVAVYNVSNGSRFETYAMVGEALSGVVCINGAAAHLARKGDIVIIAAYGLVDGAPSEGYRPRLVYVDAANHEVKGEGETT